VWNLPFDAKALLRTPSPTMQNAAALAVQSKYFLRIGIKSKWQDKSSTRIYSSTIVGAWKKSRERIIELLLILRR
jgi:hypothetical protein